MDSTRTPSVAPNVAEKPPSILYKYTSVATARAILGQGRLRFHSPLLFNDPFDAQWDPLWNLRTAEGKRAVRECFVKGVTEPSLRPPSLDARYRSFLDKVRSDWQTKPQPERDLWLRAQAEDFAGPGESEGVERAALRWQSGLRIACFSATPASTLMWSHYADQHRGVVVGFHTDQLSLGKISAPKPVRYQDDLPRIWTEEEHAKSVVYGIDPTITREQGEPLVLAKHTAWRYEQEWRIVMQAASDELGELADIEFPHDALESITFGLRTDASRARELFALALRVNKNVKRRDVERDPTRFGLVERTPS